MINHICYLLSRALRNVDIIFLLFFPWHTHTFSVIVNILIVKHFFIKCSQTIIFPPSVYFPCVYLCATIMATTIKHKRFKALQHLFSLLTPTVLLADPEPVDGRILSLKLILVRGLRNLHSSSLQSFCLICHPTVSLELIKCWGEVAKTPADSKCHQQTLHDKYFHSQAGWIGSQLDVTALQWSTSYLSSPNLQI